MAGTTTEVTTTGLNLFELARMMGTSLEQIRKTYGHLLPDVLDRTRTALDWFLAAPEAERGTGH